MLLQVRYQSGKVETVQTVDASKGGISFVSIGTYRVGEEVWFTLPFNAGTAPKETKGRIVRCQSGPRGQLYAVSFSADEAGEVTTPERKKSRFWASLTERAGSEAQRLLGRRFLNDRKAGVMRSPRSAFLPSFIRTAGSDLNYRSLLTWELTAHNISDSIFAPGSQ